MQAEDDAPLVAPRPQVLDARPAAKEMLRAAREEVTRARAARHGAMSRGASEARVAASERRLQSALAARAAAEQQLKERGGGRI